MTAQWAATVFDRPRPIEALGDLYANLWQLCYVTPDLDRGMEVMSQRLGIENFTEVPTEGATFAKDGEPKQWDVRIAMGSRGGPIIELIEPIAGEVDFYRRFLPKDASNVAFHHAAVMVPLGDEPWEAVRGLLADQGMHFEYTITIPDRARLAYVDTTAELGHYLEICQLQPADTGFFSSLIEGSA